MADQWESVLAEKDFKALPPADKAKVAHNFFQANIATEQEFQALPPEHQSKVKTNFYSTLQEDKPFEAKYPNLNAAFQTFKQTPRTLISGMTLGASEKIREKVVGPKDPEPYKDIPETSRMVGEFAGAAVPISGIGGAIATGVKTIAPKLGVAGASKFFEPAAKVASWAVAGSAYGAAEKGIKKGELPTAKELGEDAAIWGGTEAIINSLGWGGRMAMAVNSLSKAYGVAKKDVLKMVFNQAKESGSPLIEIASQKQAAQEALKSIKESKAKGEAPSPDTPSGMIYGAGQEFVKKVEGLLTGQRQKHQRGYEALRRDLSIEESEMGLDFQSMTPEQRMEAVTRKSSLSGTPPELMPKSTEMAPEYIQRSPSNSGAFEYKEHIPREERPRQVETPPTEIVQPGATSEGIPKELEPYSINGQHEYNYLHNTEKSPKPGPEDRFGQKVEPAGTYMNLITPGSVESQTARNIPGWKLGKISFNNPLIVDAPGMSKDWKVKLSKQYGGLTGKKLSDAIRKDGYDGIITMNKGNPSEVVSLKDYPELKRAEEQKAFKGYSPAEVGIETKKIATQDIPAPKSNATPTAKLFSINPAGSISGINTDENGTIQYDPMLGMVGMAAGMVVMRSSKGKAKYSDAKPNPTDSERVAGMYERSEQAIKDRYSIDWQKTKDFMVRAFVDVSGKAKEMVKSVDRRLGREIELVKNAAAGSSAEAARQYDNWHDQIWRGLTKNETKTLDNIINAKRNIEISKYKSEVKHQEGLTSDQFQAYLDDINSGKGPFNPKQVAELNKRSDLYFTAQADSRQRMFEAGILTEDSFNSLSEHIYSPRKYLQHLDQLDKSISGRSFSSGDAGIKALDEGSIGLMETRSPLLLQQSISRTQDLIARNKANLSLLKMADEFPENPVVRRSGAGEAAGRGETKITALENGEKVEMIVPQEFERSWVKTDPLMNSTLSSAIQWVSGAKILKMFATGINPAFALTNMPRDIAMVWTGGQYSRTLPIATGQFAKDFVSTLKDTFMRRGRAIDYVKEGGGMEFLTYYGKGGHMASGLMDSLNSVGKVLGWIGETSEIWTRLAHRERAIHNLSSDFKSKNGRLPNTEEQAAIQFEATQIAREGGIDFSQGGNVMKAMDNFIPYLNANVQGTRTIARNAMANKGAFTYQMAQLGATATALYAWNQHNPEAWNQISDRDKEANFCIIIPDVIPGATSYTDERGQKRYRYVKIAKDQGHRIFTAPFEAAMEFNNSGKIPSKQVFQAISDLGLPYQVPMLSAITAIAGNVDDYQWDNIWKGTKDIEQKEEYRNDTPKAFVKAGELTGLSPERMKAAANKILPFGNPIIGAVGSTIQTVTGEMGEELQKKGWNQFLSENKAVRRVLSSTSPSTEMRDIIQDAKEKSNTANLKQNRSLDDLTDKFLRSGNQDDGQKIAQFIDSQPEKDQDRLAKRYTTAYELKDVPDRGFWMSVRSAAPEARAEIIYKKVMGTNPENRQHVVDTANSVKGIVTDRVAAEFSKLMAEEKPKSKWKQLGSQ